MTTKKPLSSVVSPLSLYGVSPDSKGDAQGHGGCPGVSPCPLQEIDAGIERLKALAAKQLRVREIIPPRLQQCGVQPNVLYYRRDLNRIYGRTMADRICITARKVCKGRYMGSEVLKAVEVLTRQNEVDTVTNQPVPPRLKKGVLPDAIQEGWTPW